MFNKNGKFYSPFLLLLIASLFGLMIGPLGLIDSGRAAAQEGQEGARVFLDPPTLSIQEIGQTATVAIKIADVEDLYGAEVHLQFDPSLLEVVDADENMEGVQIAPSDELFPFVPGSTDPETGKYYYSYDKEVGGYFIAQCEADNEEGRIDYAIVLLRPASPVSAGPEGATLAVITFRCKGQGTADVNFQNPIPDEPPVKLADSEDQPIPIAEIAGATINQGVTCPEIAVERDLPGTASPGATFDVIITFTAPEDNFNAIGLTDFVPSGWEIQADKTWCEPDALEVKVTPEENKVEIMWTGPYSAGTTITAVYKVTVPEDAAEGVYTFSDGTLEYYIGSTGPCLADVTGEKEIQVRRGIPIRGETSEVNCDILSGVSLVLLQEEQQIETATSDENGRYELIAPEPGTYTIVASKAGFRDETQTITVPEGAEEVTCDFIADHGLVPKAATMSYALACVNLWLFPRDNCGLSMSKALSVVNAWLFPITEE